MIDVEVLETSDLGDRSYIAHDGQHAIVVDPQRDIDRIEALLASKDLLCVAVLETHIHNDYVTGGLQLAKRAGADYLVNAEDPVRFDRTAIADSQEHTFAAMRVTAFSTPGHTVTHLSYLVEDARQPTGQDDAAVFTGGSLLFGSVGRTDLVAEERTEELTRAQFRSAHRLAGLPDGVRVFPTHGFGSFCSSGSASGGESSTIGGEKKRNDALTAADEDSFVTTLISNLTAYPAYYAHMGPRNLEGPGPIDLSLPTLLDASQLRERLEAEEWVVDLRVRTAYAATHLSGSIGIELGDQFSTYLGWLIPWGSQLTLIGESAEDVQQAQRQLVRIGIDRPAAAAVGTPGDLAGGHATAGYAVADFAELAELDPAVRDTLTVVDTRRDDEWEAGHLEGAVHLPLHSLLTRLDEVPSGPLWVHCASGYRASIGASLLARAGHQVTLIDDEFDEAERLGLA